MTSKSLQLSQLHVCTSHKFQPQLTKKLIIFIYYLDTQLKIYIPLDQLYNINNKIRVSWKKGVICLLLISKLSPFYCYSNEDQWECHNAEICNVNT